MPRPTSAHSPHLEIPTKTIVDPGAHDLHSSEDEHFSDASEGKRKTSRPQTPVSPIPKTRVERIDDEPAHGEVPGTPAYGQRLKDAVPDEIEILSEGRLSKRSSQIIERSVSPGGTVVPRTVVEKVDPEATSYGDDPNTRAWHHRKTDSVPDLVRRSPGPGEGRPSFEEDRPRISPVHGQIPETIVTPVDTKPPKNPFSSTGSPTFDRPIKRGSIPQPNTDDDDDDDDDENENEDDDFGDDFDDFEEGNRATNDDDFGDFDEGFQQPEATDEPQPQEISSQPIQPLIDFDALSSLPNLLAATQQHLDLMFPSSTEPYISSLPTPEPISDASPIFPSERSRSLWKQLVTPPPLQPPNWTQSRIRRLFLVSLGVPVDLDEILPPSKQKKLVLPDINLSDPSRKTSESDKTLGSIARLRAQAGTGANDSSVSLDSAQSATNKDGKPRGRKPRTGPLPAPDVDLNAVKRLCATTDEKLDGFTDDELQEHVKNLETLTERTSEVLEYWLKRRDGLLKEKEAFEGVIENLVAHVRRVRR